MAGGLAWRVWRLTILAGDMDVLSDIMGFIALGIGVLAVVIILRGIFLGLVELGRAALGRRPAASTQVSYLSKVRYDVGYHLLLGLEFLIAADIIRTVVEPTLEELAVLGGIVAVRTVLGFFLHREISHLGKNV